MAKSTQPAQPRYTARQLAEEACVSTRLITTWHQRGVLPAPPRNGREPAYGPEHIVYVRAIAHLRQTMVLIDEIRDALAGKSLAELQAMVAPPAPAAAAPTKTAPQPIAAPTLKPARFPTTRWARVVVAPGIEVHVDTDVHDDVQGVARRVGDALGRSAGDRAT
jgi:DNA-binding transcriptional MerR regulator